MRYQTTEYNCGPAALQNALKVLKRNVSQDWIADLAGTTTDGTDEHGLQRAILALGFGFDMVEESSPASAWQRLMYHLLVGRPVVLCVDRWGHWITVVGACGWRLLAVDPARYPFVIRENGILVLEKDRLMKRWRAARRVAGKNGPRYFGMAIGVPR